jgi:hypothetical protein
LADAAPVLRESASSYSWGLGLVDYLDVEGAEHACTLRVQAPLDRSTIMRMSREGMRRAEHYVRVLRESGAGRPIVAFASLNLAWAKTRLDRVHDDEPARPRTPSTLPPSPRRQRRSVSGL